MIVQNHCIILHILVLGTAGYREEMSMNVTSHQKSEREEQRMRAGRAELADLIARAVRDDGTATPLPGLMFRRASSPTPLGHGVSYPSFCVMAQGSKEMLLG